MLLRARVAALYMFPHMPLRRSLRNLKRAMNAQPDITLQLQPRDESGQSRLRPDKLAVTVTTIQSQRDPEDTYVAPIHVPSHASPSKSA
jgi:hypothetical protein